MKYFFSIITSLLFINFVSAQGATIPGTNSKLVSNNIYKTNSSNVPYYAPKQDLKFWYAFDNNILDEIGTFTTSTVLDSISYTSDRFNNSSSALQLGLGAIQLPSGVFDYSRDSLFSMAFWVKNESTSSARLFSTENSEGNFRIANNGGLNDGSFLLQFGDYQLISPTNPEEWNHVAYVYNNYQEKVYLNGDLIIENFDEKVESLHPYSNPFTIGAKASSTSSDRWNGALDDFAIWNRELSEQEVLNLYNSSLPSDINQTIYMDSLLVYDSNIFSIGINVSTINSIDSLSSFQFSLPIPEGLLYKGLDSLGTHSENGLLSSNVTDSSITIGFASSDFLEGDKPLVKLNFEGSPAKDFHFKIQNAYLNNSTVTDINEGVVGIIRTLGDIDDDGVILAYDASIALQYSVGLDPLPSIDSLNWDYWRIGTADVNKDDMVLASDASDILKYSIGLIDNFDNTLSKVAAPDITILATGGNLIFENSNNGLFGLNAEFSITENNSFDDPLTSGNILSAFYISDNLYRIGIASSESINGQFLSIPINELGNNESLSITYYANSISNQIDVDLTNALVSNEDSPSLPSNFKLHQNYPNPFNPTTNISFSVPNTSNVTIKLHDSLGREIGVLANKSYSAGTHTINFNASNLSSGVYFYTFENSEYLETRKMMLIK